MKKYLLAIAISVALPLASFAGASDVTLTTSTILSVGGYNLTISGTSAVVQSIVVNASSFSAVLLPTSVIAVSSASGQVLANDAPTANITGNQCVGGVSTLTLSSVSGSAVTVVVTPSSAICTGSATNSSSANTGSNGGPGGGGGGGGGSTYITPAKKAATPAKPAVPATPAVPGVSKAIPATPAVPAIPAVGRALGKGAVHADVKILQQILNSDPDTRVATKGVGSPGKETTTLGPATVKAIQKFQLKYKLAKPGDSGYGILGPKTRAKMSEFGGVKASPAAAPAAPASTSNAATADVAKQLSDSVKLLQALQEQLKTVKK